MRIPERLEILVRGFGRGVFPHQLGWILDLPGRGLLLSPGQVASRLQLAPEAQVLEVGPGTGRYSVAVAREVPAGCLTLLDLQPEMLARSAQWLRAAGITHFRTVHADGASLPFADAAFDAIYLVTVFGEIADQTAFLAEAHRVLKPGGGLSISEHHPGPDFEPAGRVAAQVMQRGFVVAETHGWRWSYTLHAIKPRDHAGASRP